MSILKGILHHWNKTTKSYDTIHPETESAQITDWNQGIVNTLASTALGTLVSTLTSDSLLATMIQKVLTASGVKYNIAQNGYICFGEFFGGLILQWGYLAEVSTDQYITYPIAGRSGSVGVVCPTDPALPVAGDMHTATRFRFRCSKTTNFRWIALVW